jgi:uroporphyrinogen decarboxylase
MSEKRHVTSRERVLTALDHREPDRVPIDVGSWGPTAIHTQAYQGLLGVLGIQEEVRLGDVVSQCVEPSERVLEMLGADVRGIRVGGPANTVAAVSEDCLRDQWGAVWRKPQGATCYSLVQAPLARATRKDLARFAWPDGSDPNRVTGLREKARRLSEESRYAVLGEVSGNVLQRAQMIRGFETFLMDLVDDTPFAEELMDRIVEVEISILSHFLDAVGPYLDVVAFKDDIATQAGPTISPAMFRRLVKPRLRRIVEAIRARTHARVLYHSCGSVWYAIRDLIEIGVEILNPIQVAARDMDPARLKREFGGNLSFWGAVDTQRVLPFGSPEEVEDEVQRRVLELAPGGGYVLASVHNIEADVPGENVWAMFRTAQEWGRYPLRFAVSVSR